MSAEEIFQQLRSIVESVNVLIAMYSEEEGPMGNISVSDH